MAELGFQGLLLRGPDEAFARLGEPMVDKQSAEKLLKLFPHLIETHGLPRVAGLTEEAAAGLPPLMPHGLSMIGGSPGGIVHGLESATRHRAMGRQEERPGRVRATGKASRERPDESRRGMINRQPRH